MRASAFRKTLAAVLAALFAISFVSCAPRSPKDVQSGPTPAPMVTYTTTHYIRYWPEDAGYDDCDYSAVIELPEFSKTFTAGYSMNQAVSGYLEDLQERIEKQYIPQSTAAKPHTDVSVSVEYIPGCTNVIFTETHSYLENTYTRTHVLMLNDQGIAMNLCDVFLDYHTAEHAAELVSEMEKTDLTSALGMIDITNGAKATLAGCTLFLRAQKPGGEEKKLDLSFDELSPAGRLNGVSFRELEKLTRLLCYVSDAAVVRQENIIGGELSAFEASSFMGEFIMSLGITPEAGRLNVKKNDFEGYYRSIFGREFPGIDPDGHDIKLEDDVYRVLRSPKPYEYHIDIIGSAAEGDILTLTGDLIFGPFGYAYTQYVCHVTVMLERSTESPFGFKLVDFMMNA